MRKVLFSLSLFAIALTASASNPDENEAQESAFEDSRFYLEGTASAKTAYSVNASAATFNVALGAGYFLSPSFSLELGGSYNNINLESDDEVGGGALGALAALVYHKPIGGNLKYIPQLQTEYMHMFIDKYRFNFLEVGLAPLAFEYRADDSNLGIVASIGALGMAFPLGETADTFKPAYIISLNNVSLGLVLYF